MLKEDINKYRHKWQKQEIERQSKSGRPTETQTEQTRNGIEIQTGGRERERDTESDAGKADRESTADIRKLGSQTAVN